MGIFSQLRPKSTRPPQVPDIGAVGHPLTINPPLNSTERTLRILGRMQSVRYSLIKHANKGDEFLDHRRAELRRLEGQMIGAGDTESFDDESIQKRIDKLGGLN